MTNLKRLKVIKLFPLIFLLICLSCARIPSNGLFTDQQYDIKSFEQTPVMVFVQNDLKNLSHSWDYLKIAKKKYPHHKSIVLITQELTIEEKKILEENIALIDGFAFQGVNDFSLETSVLKNKIILNSGIIDIFTDDYYLAAKTKRSLSFEYNEKKYLFQNNLDSINPPKDEREFQFYLEDPFMGLLKVRKEERKNQGLNYLIMGSQKNIELIKNQSHPYLFFKVIPEPKQGFFTLGENLIELCSFFYRATDDCHQAESGQFVLEETIKSQREKKLKENSDKKSAQFLGEEILTTN